MANPNPNSAKPWKVDYAKTSRSSCKTCKNSIVKGSLRIAKMVAARQFEGIMPMWNHADCVLMHRGQFQKINDLEGFDALQIGDQEKIKKYLHDLDDKSVPATFEKTEIDGIEDSFIEKAKSSRSACKSCNQKIVKGEVRISTTADPENPWYRGTMAAWRHAKCFIEIGWWTSPVEKMSGWDKLSDEDKQAVKDMTDQYIKSGKIDPKHKLEENEALSDENQNSGYFPNKKTKMSKGDMEASEESTKNLEKQTKKGGLVIDALGFLKTLVAGMFDRIQLETGVPEGMQGMEDIPSDLVDTVKYLKKAKTQLEHLQTQNEELKATNVLAKSKLEKEFAVVQLSATHQKELEAFADDQRPLMEIIYKACLYKHVQKVK